MPDRKQLRFEPIPCFVLEVVDAGGLIPMLK